MTVRDYRPEDCKALAQLFYDTVHRINARHYTMQQLAAWAPRIPDETQWATSFLVGRTLVAEENGIILGFGDMDTTGYLNRLFVHADHQRRGIATAICDRLEQESDAAAFTTHASITARPFFEKRGYRVVREQQVERCGVCLTNYVMKKE